MTIQIKSDGGTVNATRETVYECTYASSTQLRTAHVRAWDAGEAAELFAHELRSEGVSERGNIRASGRGGRGVRRMAYSPSPLVRLRTPARRSRG